MAQLDIAHLQDEITGATLEELVARVKFFMRLEKELTFQNIFCASTKERFEQVADYMAKHLEIPSDRVLSYNLEEGNLRRYLEELQRDSNLKSSLLVKVTGYLIKGDDRVMDPHHYGQIMGQYMVEELGRENLPNPKKILTLTHLDNEVEKEVYELAIRNSLSARFKLFTFEFK